MKGELYMSNSCEAYKVRQGEFSFSSKKDYDRKEEIRKEAIQIFFSPLQEKCCWQIYYDVI